MIAQKFSTIEALVRTKAEDFQKVHEIGEVMASSLEDFFSQDKAKQLIMKLKKADVNMTEPKESRVSDKLAGKKFVFTGELEGISRHEATERVEAQGGTVTSAVSKATDYVVAGRDPGSKFTKAKESGLKILNQKEFEELVHG